MPRLRGEGHPAHQEDEADERPLDHQLAAEAIRDPAPERRQQRRHGRRDAQAETGPHRHVADVADAELLQVERQERHHQREAGEADEGRRGTAKTLRCQEDTRGQPLASEADEGPLALDVDGVDEPDAGGWLCITTECVRMPSPKKRTPFISAPSVTPVAAKMSDSPDARSADE